MEKAFQIDFPVVQKIDLSSESELHKQNTMCFTFSFSSSLCVCLYLSTPFHFTPNINSYKHRNKRESIVYGVIKKIKSTDWF